MKLNVALSAIAVIIVAHGAKVACVAGATDRESVLVVCAHPDDSIAVAGTLFLMKDRFDIHIADLTKGERGLGRQGFLDGSTAKRRMEEEESAQAMIGSHIHWLGFIDGELFCSSNVVNSLVNLIDEVKPRVIFAMWPIDRHPDHIMAGSAAMMAARKCDFRGEFYFYEEIFQSKGFTPVYFVDVSLVAEKKWEYLRKYACQNRNDWMLGMEQMAAKVRGNNTFHLVQSAEVFAPLPGGVMQGARCVFSELPRAAERRPCIEGGDSK